jgi:hypothetical protein
MWSHATICKREKSNIKFLPDKFWSSEMKFRSSADECQSFNNHILQAGAFFTSANKAFSTERNNRRLSLSWRSVEERSVLILLRTVELRPPDAVAAGKVEVRHRYTNLYACSQLWPYRYHLTNVELRQWDFSLNSSEPKSTIISFFSKALSNTHPPSPQPKFAYKMIRTVTLKTPCIKFPTVQ